MSITVTETQGVVSGKTEHAIHTHFKASMKNVL